MKYNAFQEFCSDIIQTFSEPSRSSHGFNSAKQERVIYLLTRLNTSSSQVNPQCRAMHLFSSIHIDNCLRLGTQRTLPCDHNMLKPEPLGLWTYNHNQCKVCLMKINITFEVFLMTVNIVHQTLQYSFFKLYSQGPSPF